MTPETRRLIYFLDDAVEGLECGHATGLPEVLDGVRAHLGECDLGREAGRLAELARTAEGGSQWRLDQLAMLVRRLREALACNLAGGHLQVV